MLHKAAADGFCLSESATVRCLDGRSLHVSDDGEIPRVSALVTAADMLDCRTVYIVSDKASTVYPHAATSVDNLRVYPSGPAGEPPTTWTVDHPGRPGDPVVLMALHADSRWEMFHRLRDDRLLLGAAAVQASTGLVPRYSPGHMARVLLDQTVSNPVWLRPLTVELPRIRSIDLAWVAPFGAEHVGGLHAWDVNAAYLAVAGDQDLGVGDPEPLPPDSDPERVTGYAFLQVRAHPAGSAWNGLHLPSPFGSKPPHLGRAAGVVTGWWAAPHVALALNLGWSVDILGGLSWPERHRVLRYWAKRLWDARMELSDAERYPDRVVAAAATAVVKRIYTQGIGLFGRVPTQVPEGDDPASSALRRLARRRFYRPDWRAWIMAECYRRRVSALARYDRSAGTPVAARTDMVVIASPDGLSREGGVLTRPEGLGGYRLVWSLTERGALTRLGALAAHGPTVQRFLDTARKEARH